MSSSRGKVRVQPVRAIIDWAKEVLIDQVVLKGDSLCELYCGIGYHLGKWQRAGISRFVGVDASPEALAQTDAAVRRRRCQFNAELTVLDCARDELTLLDADRTTHVACFNGLAPFSSRASLAVLLDNVVAALEPDGYFFGLTLDSAAVWARLAKDERSLASGVYKSASGVYSVEFEPPYRPFGTAYTLVVSDESKRRGYFVHMPTFVSMARERGLALVELVSVQQFYEQQRRNYGELLARMQVLDRHGREHRAQKEVAELYAFFVFRHVGSGPGGAGAGADGGAAGGGEAAVAPLS